MNNWSKNLYFVDSYFDYFHHNTVMNYLPKRYYELFAKTPICINQFIFHNVDIK
jgi:hypothetical protein